MTLEDLNKLVENLVSKPTETDAIEFKINYSRKEDLGKLISALSNAASLYDRKSAFLAFGRHKTRSSYNKRQD